MKRILGLGLTLALLAPACGGKEENPEELAARIGIQLDSADEYVVNGRYANARQLYENVLAIDEKRARAVRGLGQIELQEKRPDKAIPLLQRAAQLDPKDAETHAALADAHHAKENYAAAAESYARAYALKPSEGRYGLALGNNQRLAKQLDAAVATLRKVADDDDRVKYVFSELGDALRAANKPDEALAAYMKAQSTYASDKAARAGAAFVYESKGEITLAINEWSEYIRMDCCSTYSNAVAKPRVAKLRAIEESGGAVDKPAVATK